MGYSADNVVSYTVCYNNPSVLGEIDYHGKKILILLNSSSVLNSSAGYSSVICLNAKTDEYLLSTHEHIMGSLRQYRVTQVNDIELSDNMDLDEETTEFDVARWDSLVRDQLGC